MPNDELERLKREAQAQLQARIQAKEDVRKKEEAQGLQDFEAMLRRELSPAVYNAVCSRTEYRSSNHPGEGCLRIRAKNPDMRRINRDGRVYDIWIFNAKEWRIDDRWDDTLEGAGGYKGNLGDGSLQNHLLLYVL